MNPLIVLVGSAIAWAVAIVIIERRSDPLPKRVPGQAAADLEEHWASLNDIFDQDDEDDVAAIQHEAARRAWDRHHSRCPEYQARVEADIEQQLGRRFTRKFNVLDGPRRGAS